MTRAERQLLLYQSPPHPCGYVNGRVASSVFIDPDALMDSPSYGALLQQGFRRSGRHVYRPQCPDCQACTPARIPVAAFRPRRRHRRVLAGNRDVVVRQRAASYDDSHFALYKAYMAARHPDGEMATGGPDEYRDFLLGQWSDTLFLEFREAGRLLAVAVTDQVPDGLSAVYTFFDPGLPERSLGVLAILTQWRLARELGLSHLYLGYWIGDCVKMRYKGDYRPLQLLQDGRWRTFGAADPLPGDGHKPG